jgi:hypothetical protein
MANEIKNDISERICDEEDLLRVAGLVASIPDRKLPAELILRSRISGPSRSPPFPHGGKGS